MRRTDIDWAQVDWSVSNAALARRLGCNAKTVRAARLRLTGATHRHTITREHHRALAAGRRESLAEGGYATAYAARSAELTGYAHGRGDTISATHLTHGELHASAKTHELHAPSGATYCIRNVALFVREHPELFEHDDLVERRKPSGNKYVKAVERLQAVSAGRMKTWKGWT